MLHLKLWKIFFFLCAPAEVECVQVGNDPREVFFPLSTRSFFIIIIIVCCV